MEYSYEFQAQLPLAISTIIARRVVVILFNRKSRITTQPVIFY